MFDDDQETRFQKIHDTYGNDPDMLAAALVASDELLDRYKTQAERYRRIAVAAIQKLREALRQSRERGLKVARLRQEVADRVTAYYQELKNRLTAAAEDREAKTELERITRLLIDKETECAEWERRHQELQARIEAIKSALDDAREPAVSTALALTPQVPAVAPAVDAAARTAPALKVIDTSHLPEVAAND